MKVYFFTAVISCFHLQNPTLLLTLLMMLLNTQRGNDFHNLPALCRKVLPYTGALQDLSPPRS